MEEKTLIKICLFSIIIGIILMFFANRLVEPKEVTISEISQDDNFVKIKGEITSITVSKSETIFLKLSDETGMINGIIFKNSIKNSEKIKTGDYVRIIGKPEKYKESMELIINQIEVLP